MEPFFFIPKPLTPEASIDKEVAAARIEMQRKLEANELLVSEILKAQKSQKENYAVLKQQHDEFVAHGLLEQQKEIAPQLAVLKDTVEKTDKTVAEISKSLELQKRQAERVVNQAEILKVNLSATSINLALTKLLEGISSGVSSAALDQLKDFVQPEIGEAAARQELGLPSNMRHVIIEESLTRDSVDAELEKLQRRIESGELNDKKPAMTPTEDPFRLTDESFSRHHVLDPTSDEAFLVAGEKGVISDAEAELKEALDGVGSILDDIDQGRGGF